MGSERNLRFDSFLSHRNRGSVVEDKRNDDETVPSACNKWHADSAERVLLTTPEWMFNSCGNTCCTLTPISLPFSVWSSACLPKSSGLRTREWQAIEARDGLQDERKLNHNV
jgi:hypothetical protein